MSSDEILEFGPYQLHRTQQLLLEGQRPVQLGSRAFFILVALVESAGKIISKEDLVARVWPGTFVDESNLRVNIAGLRRALRDGQAGERYVTTIPGRGYCFVAPVSATRATQGLSPRKEAPPGFPRLPLPPAHTIGRDEIVAAIADELPRRRFVTLTGPGGIGKTTVALAIAERLGTVYRDGLYFLDLAPVADPALAPTALASLIGLAPAAGDPLPGLISHLKNKSLLLILDSCEHLVEAAAVLAETLYKEVPDIHLLATSREPLRADGERVRRLPALDSPPASLSFNASGTLGFAAAQLFVERAAANTDSFEFVDADAPFVAEICRKLDGIPLALELAAGSVEAFGVKGLATLLENRLRPLSHGRRTSAPRHRTLTATLDWSYGWLPEAERLVLRRLGVFAGRFTLPTALDIAGFDGGSAGGFHEAIGNLAAKSLLAVDLSDDIARYRLLDTTRAYAREKLAEQGESGVIARRHADYHCKLFERAEIEWQTRPKEVWLAEYRQAIDDLRAALDWAFAPGGDGTIGVALTLAAYPLWFQLSLIDECRTRLFSALACIRTDVTADARAEMRLRAHLGWALMASHAHSTQAADSPTQWNRVLDLATDLGDTEHLVRAQRSLFAHHFNNGEHRTALSYARAYAEAAVKSPDPVDSIHAEGLVGFVLRTVADLEGARCRLERMLAASVLIPPAAGHSRFRLAIARVQAHVALAYTLWLQGFPDRAMRRARMAVEDAQGSGLATHLCYALAEGVGPLALLTGDLIALDRDLAILQEKAAQHGLTQWAITGEALRGALLMRRGEAKAGAAVLAPVFEERRRDRSGLNCNTDLTVLAGGSVPIETIEHGLLSIDEALGRSAPSEEYWRVPELLRVEGEIALKRDGVSGAAAAEALFCRALESARAQGALSWELRAATSLASLRYRQHRADEVSTILEPVYRRFTEGLATADLLAAKALLDRL